MHRVCRCELAKESSLGPCILDRPRTESVALTGR
jgi:hypothetical protein